MLASILLIEVSGAARVRGLYDASVSTNDHLYYSLIVLPELLQQLLTSLPTLLHRMGLADAYCGWRTAAWGWVLRAFPAAGDGDSEQGKEAATERSAPSATSLTADSTRK